MVVETLRKLSSKKISDFKDHNIDEAKINKYLHKTFVYPKALNKNLNN